jgi:hypothetical protein
MPTEARVSTGTGRPAARPAAPSRWRWPGRRAWDSQPAQPASVLIATVGTPIPAAVIRRAVGLSDGRPVAVVTIARVYGSSLGLPNPGLLPTRRELDEQRALVATAIGRLERSGVQGWGQVAATRRYAATIARVASARGASHVLVVTERVPRWRAMIEGDLALDVGRRLPAGVRVEPMPAAPRG